MIFDRFRCFSSRQKSFRGLSLIELMVAVSVLAIGIVGVARSLLATADGLDYAQQRIQRIQFIDRVMAEMTQKAWEKKGLSVDDKDILSFLVGQREEALQKKIGSFDWSLSELSESSEVIECSMHLNWRRGSKSYDAELAAYFQAKK